jgi:hypothetical protein
MNIGFSSILAGAFGITIPMLGIVRNWTISERTTASGVEFFFELIVGAFLLYGAWKVRENVHAGRRFLTAGWGLACGLFYSDIVSLLRSTAFDDELTVAFTSIAMLLAVAGLATSLRSTRIK